MPLFPLPSSPAPAFVGFTQNSEASGAAVGSFDLLCLSGMIISILEDNSFSASSGIGLLSIHLYVDDDAMDPTEPENLSVRSTDSSALKSAMQNAWHRQG